MKVAKTARCCICSAAELYLATPQAADTAAASVQLPQLQLALATSLCGVTMRWSVIFVAG
jgi:hypothetical protein